LADKLKSSGVFHMATDWESYAEDAMNLLCEHPRFNNTTTDRSYVQRPDTRPKTKFEKRGEGLGYGVWDLMFEKK
jgi:tRNA (guanine-N7-)-methyltransferase